LPIGRGIADDQLHRYPDTSRHNQKGKRVLNAVLMVAAGRGERAGGAQTVPKQYARMGGEPVLTRSLKTFLSHPAIGLVQVVIHPDDRPLYDAAVAEVSGPIAPPVSGGPSRQDSVRAGLRALSAAPPDHVLIHDAARPLVTHEVIDRVLAALGQHAGAIAALPLADTLKRTDVHGVIAETIGHSGLWRAQTPQGFRFAAILAAHEAGAAAGRSDFTDDAAIAAWAGHGVVLVPGDERNFKLTVAEDLAMAERLVAAAPVVLDVRTGSGFDVHRLAPGTRVRLCGVDIPHTHTLEGHSDADVGLHALTDAILGAISEGDIGQHFPPSDSRWRGVSSRIFLEEAARRVAERGGRISNLDITLLCEAPRIAPHRETMRTAIATILGIDVARVGVKATTTEGLGFTGRGEGIAAAATATIILPAR
jgi:2-C-methyl-D-erythritol 4-phosphate cytidylyltransferase/2-C-methyl-D-erythritol 2,4-cyclodiphosphate synthase